MTTPRNDQGRKTVTVTLPLPDRALHPNARVHWAKKAKATKAARRSAWLAAFDVMTQHPLTRTMPWKRATVQARFYVKDKRGLNSDGDGRLASLKAYFDGLADGKMITNDRGLTHLPVSVEIDRGNTRVELEITEQPGATA